MKSILSPYDDYNFNIFLLAYIKKRLKQKCFVFTKDEEDRKYFFEKDSRDYYTPDDVINTLKLNGRHIYFSNKQLINYIVYDLSQRFWYDELKHINNMIHTLYIKYKGTSYSKKRNINKKNNSIITNNTNSNNATNNTTNNNL